MPVRPCITGIGFRGAAAGNIARLAGRMAGKAVPPPLTRRTHATAGEWMVADLPDEGLVLPPDMPEAMAATTRRAVRRAPAASIAALNAACEAWAMAALPWQGGDRTRLAIVTTGQGAAVIAGETARLAAGQAPSPYAVPHGLGSFPLSLTSEAFGICGAGLVADAGQASGLAAIMAAARLITGGEADAVLALGVPHALSPAEVAGYRVLGALAGDDGADGVTCHPFDVNSTGFLPAEIAAALILEHPDAARARGARPLATLKGWASRLHASSQPSPDRAAEAGVMRAALRHAGLLPESITLVSAHATGTPQGDRAEAGAIMDALGASPLVQAPKSLIGHGLASAGVAETVMAVLALQGRIVHGNAGLLHPVLEGVRFAGGEGHTMPVGSILKTAFGFGGINAALVLTEAGT